MSENKTEFCKRKHNRYKNFDYSSSGAYFVTICAYQKRHIFGEVILDDLSLNELGQVIAEQIEALQDYPNIDILSYIVMPNHVHVLFQVQNDGQSTALSLSDVIRILKSKVYVEYRKKMISKDTNFSMIEIWQRSYWDHIVRKEEDLVTIDEYIQRNAEFWSMEKDNPETDYPVNRNTKM